MKKSVVLAMTAKWTLVVQEYELVKQKRSKNFKTVEQICNAYKVHRKDIRKYYERWVKSGKDNNALLPLKRGPKPGRLKILTKNEERIITKINRKLQANEFEIYHLLKARQDFRIHPSVSTIYRTLKRYPLNKERKEKIKRYEKSYPGELLHCDTFYLPKTLFLDRVRRYLVGVIDDCTRLCYVEVINGIQSATVTKAFFSAYKWFGIHGIKAEEVMTDNGIEFTSYTSQKAKETHFFETMLKIFDIKHKYTHPYRPQSNGKIERFWETLNYECIRVQAKTLSMEEFTDELKEFMYNYNYQRRHGGLNYITPLEKLQNVTEILK